MRCQRQPERKLKFVESKPRKQLYTLYSQAIEDNGDGEDGEDDEGAGTGATSPLFSITLFQSVQGFPLLAEI